MKSSYQESLRSENEEVSLPAAPAAADPQKACSSEAVPSAAEPTAAGGTGRGGFRNSDTRLYSLLPTPHPATSPASLPVTGRSEKAGLTGTVDSTWLPVVGQKVGSGHRCLVHTSVMILEPATHTRAKSG